MELRLNRLRFLFGLLLSSYFLLGIGSHFLLRREIFPVFSWFLFSRTPNKTTQFTIVIFEHNGQILEPPVLFNEAPDSIARSGDIDANTVINSLGISYIQNNQEEVSEKRNLIEDVYLKGSVEYGLVKQTYDPILKYKFNQTEQEILVKFSSGED